MVYQTICDLHPACSTHLTSCNFSMHIVCYSYAELLTFSKLSVLFYAWRASPSISFSEKSPSILTDLINFFISKFYFGHFSYIPLVLRFTITNCWLLSLFSFIPISQLLTFLHASHRQPCVNSMSLQCIHVSHVAVSMLLLTVYSSYAKANHPPHFIRVFSKWCTTRMPSALRYHTKAAMNIPVNVSLFCKLTVIWPAKDTYTPERLIF